MKLVNPCRIKGLQCAISALTVVAMALAAEATMYYWKGPTGDSSYGNWSDTSNWSTESESGADATAAPGASDTLYGLQAPAGPALLSPCLSQRLPTRGGGLGGGAGRGSDSTLAWKFPWLEESGGLQSTGSLRVGHD